MIKAFSRKAYQTLGPITRQVYVMLKGQRDISASTFTGRALVPGIASGTIIFSDVALSFWGGVDSQTGEVIDRYHPLSSQVIAGKILAIPGGRGSCTGS